MKSISKAQIIEIAKKHALPSSLPVPWEFVDSGLLSFVSEVLAVASDQKEPPAQSFTPEQKAKLLKQFKNHTQGLKGLAELGNGIDHELAAVLLSQIEISAANLEVAMKVIFSDKGGR